MNKFLIKLQLFITFQDNDLQKSPSICFSNINNLLAKLMLFFSGTLRLQKRIDNRDDAAETQEIETGSVLDRNSWIRSQLYGH